MVHPTPAEDLYPRVSVVAHMRVQYTGRESHAAIAPELGVNAADAFTIAQVAIGLLREHLRPSDQVHGIVTHGGDATNVVPTHTEGTWMARARTLAELEQLSAARRALLRSGRARPAATLRLTDVCPRYVHMEHDHDLAELYRSNAHTIGRPDSEDGVGTFSTDMGNVSLAMPSIPPVHRDRHRRCGEPPTGVHRGGDQRLRRSGGRRRRARDGVDRRRRRDRAAPRAPVAPSVLGVLGHQVGDSRLIGGWPPSAVWRRRVL